MRAGRRSRLRWTAAVAAVALAWIAVPGGVPLYDGINFPDEPYRYVAPPAGYHDTPKPTSASGSSAVESGTNAATIYVDAQEQAPQLSVVIPGRVVAVGRGARTVTVRGVPEAPDRQPSKGSIDGNVYRLTGFGIPDATATFAPPHGDVLQSSMVVMRATSARSPAPVFLYRASPSLAWRPLVTARWGNDIYRTQFAGFGDYALAFGTVAPTHHGSSGGAILVSALLVLVLLAVAAVVVVRFQRRPRA